jgi:hypothetical protein
MIYLQRKSAAIGGNPVIEIVAVEDARSAAPYEAQGYECCSFEAFREAWRLRDQISLNQIMAARQKSAPTHGIYPSAS